MRLIGVLVAASMAMALAVPVGVFAEPSARGITTSLRRLETRLARIESRIESILPQEVDQASSDEASLDSDDGEDACSKLFGWRWLHREENHPSPPQDLLDNCNKQKQSNQTLQCDALFTTRQDCGFIGIQQNECESRGCCWAPKTNSAFCFRKVDTTSIVAPAIPVELSKLEFIGNRAEVFDQVTIGPWPAAVVHPTSIVFTINGNVQEFSFAGGLQSFRLDGAGIGSFTVIAQGRYPSGLSAVTNLGEVENS